MRYINLQHISEPDKDGIMTTKNGIKYDYESFYGALESLKSSDNEKTFLYDGNIRIAYFKELIVDDGIMFEACPISNLLGSFNDKLDEYINLIDYYKYGIICKAIKGDNGIYKILKIDSFKLIREFDILVE